MPYSLEDYKGCFRRYVFDRPDLTREDRVKLYAFLDQLRQQGDSFRGDPDRRLDPGSSCFWFDPVFADSTCRLRHFRIVVDDVGAAYGVLRIVYIDEAAPLG